MFTGLIEATGSVRSLETTHRGARLSVATPLAAQLRPGDSVSVSGVCLTVVQAGADAFSADVMPETLARSALEPLAQGDAVNLELPVRASDRLGGHIVQGHVDGVAHVEDVTPDGLSTRLRLACEAQLLRYVVEKGSIAIDGVSLTVAEVDGDGFAVSLIPDTLARTTLGAVVAGTLVNLEVDVLAKYVEKLAPLAARA